MSSTTQIPVWLVTGTSNGIGLALAKHILTQGHHLVSTSRYSEPHSFLQSQTTSGSLNHVQLDLSIPDPEVVKAATQKAQSIHGRIDVLVNMAGVAYFGPLETTPPSKIHEVFQVNYFSPLYIIQAILPHLRTDKTSIPCSKTIINVSSTQGLSSDPSETSYDSSKHALEAASEVLSMETHNTLCNNIRTIIVEPGAFKSNLVAGSNLSNTSQKSDAEELPVLAPPYSDADHPVGKRMRMVEKYGGGQVPGDPDKAAQVIFDAVMNRGTPGALMEAWDQTEPGKKGEAQRIILGRDAWTKLDRKIDGLRQNLDDAKDIAQSTDFDDWNWT